MPSKSSSNFYLHKLRGFHLKRLKRQKRQASTSLKFVNSSIPSLQTSGTILLETKESSPDLCHVRSSASVVKRYKEIKPKNITTHTLKLQDGRPLMNTSNSDVKEVGKISGSSKNYFRHFCTSSVKHLAQRSLLKSRLLLSRKRANLPDFETRGSDEGKITERKIVSLPNNLTVEAIHYKCKILQLHDTKCNCSTPRLHIYLTTNHRCGDKCSAESYQYSDNISSNSPADIPRNKYIFAVMTGKSKAKGQLKKITSDQKVRKTPRKKGVKSLTNTSTFNNKPQGRRKSLMTIRNEEPESELLGEECESLPTIMSTLSGDVEYIVLDDNTFNLNANMTNTSQGKDDPRSSNAVEGDVKPEIQSLVNAQTQKEGRSWEDILERCLSEVSYQSGRYKGGLNQLQDNKIKSEPAEEGTTTKNTEASSSLAEVCTNHCPSIRDIFGDVNIKDEPVDNIDENDMSVEAFSQEIMRLTDAEKSGNGNSWSVDKSISLDQEISSNKGLFAGLLKEEIKVTKDESKEENKSITEVHIKEENDTNKESKDNDGDDDYSSDSSLGPLQIDEGEQPPAEEEAVNVPVMPTPATSLILPSVNIISPFKIKIFFGTPHRVHLEKPHELFEAATVSAPVTGASPIQNSVVSNKSSEKKPNVMEEEDSETDSSQALVQSEPTPMPSLTCAYCQTVCSDIKALAKHFEDHQRDGLIICYFCQKSFGDKTSMKRHMRTHTGEKPYQCKVCGKRFSLPGNFKKHRDIHEDIRTEPCEVCGKTFRRKEHLKYHMRTHTGEKPYTCGECGTSFTARYSLQIHMNIHLGKKPYKCTYCTKAFSDKSTMRKHVRVHTGEKPFHCEMCGRCFGESGTLAAHMATHRTERPYKCKLCSLCFKTTGGLRQHEKIHTGLKQYACRFCGVKFLQKYNMTMHERIHTGEKPYSCSHCSRSFRSRSCLAKHVVLHGGEEERRYECEHCNSRFYRKAHLRRHIDTHLGIKNYECDICSKKFCTRISLVNHLKTFHAQGARRFPCTWCGRVFKRQVYVHTHECIRDPEKVEQYKNEMRAAAAAAAAGDNTQSKDDKNENSSDSTDYSNIDIKSEPEELVEEVSGLGSIESVIGNANFDAPPDLKTEDPS
ncbi:zinc finger and BTB domain-containing protein 11-like [Macrobrachium nipponense]|uniref:zinc finger and BTB domain-containing protein 11-like n=1 Tax=Macrobrachium nipponense TaxID=159736 RepID=UPI0030C846E3